jgi:hypothetical protein
MAFDPCHSLLPLRGSTALQMLVRFLLVPLRHKNRVIAGLDPAIQLFAKKMDPRVKPADDAERCFIAGFLNL